MYHIAITGHRPKDLGGVGARVIKDLTCNMLDRAQARAGSNDIMIHTGGALGVDQWVAAAVLNSPYYGQGHEHTLHLPFKAEVMATYWQPSQAQELGRIMGQSTAVCEHCPKGGNAYNPAQYQRRNMHMVDSAEVLVAFWTGKRSGGTYNAIQYAWNQRKPIYNALMNMERVRL